MAEYIVLRSSVSGVWFGRALKRGPNGEHMLAEARRVFAWQGALSCASLAAFGPGSGSRIEAPLARAEISPCAAGGDERLSCSPEAVAAFQAAPIAR